jgi:type IV pilus assembly protein PilM
MLQNCWGLDISRSSLKAVKIQLSKEGFPEVTEIVILPYTLSATRDEAALEQEIRNALTTFLSQHKLKGCFVVASLPGHSTFNRFVKIPYAEGENLHKSIEAQAQQQMPFPINEAIWAYQIIESSYQPDKESDIVLFALKRETINQFMSTLNAVGLSVDNIQFAPVALYNFIAYDQDIDKDTVVLDMGAQNTDLILIEGDKFWVRNLPVVGNDLTKALQQKFDIPFTEAEQLKQVTKGSQQAGKVFNAIQPVLKDLVSEIHRSIGYYKSLSANNNPLNFERMFIAGNSSKVIYFQEFISQRLQLEPLRITQLNKLDCTEQIDKSLLDNQLPSLGVALGLALQGLGLTKNRINLLPHEIIRKKEIAQKKPWVAAIAIITILILGLLHFSAQGKYSRLDIKDQEIKSLVKDCKKIEKLYTEAQQTKDLDDQLKNLVNIIPDQNIWLKIFNTFKQIDVFNMESPDFKKGYLSIDNADDLTALKNFEARKIWILNLKAAKGKAKNSTKDETHISKPVINLSILCSLVAFRKSDGSFDSINSQEFVKNYFVKPLAQQLNIAEETPIPLDSNNPVADLESPEEDKTIKKGGTDFKYYRYRVELEIPLEP